MSTLISNRDGYLAFQTLALFINRRFRLGGTCFVPRILLVQISEGTVLDVLRLKYMSGPGFLSQSLMCMKEIAICVRHLFIYSLTN
jgi:hypothetical protein